MKKKIVALVLALMLCLSCALPVSAAGENKFTDVPDNAWYAEAVNALADGGVLKGRGNGIFDPTAPVTLAELSVVLMRLSGFGDQIANEDHWAGNAMYSLELGIEWTDEGERYTYANDPAYRGDAVAELGIFAWYDFQHKYREANPGSSLQEVYDATNEYTSRYDLSSIADREEYRTIGKTWSYVVGYYYGENGHNFYYENIDMAYQFGVINGIDKNHTCNATGTLTRAELAQMCYNMGWTTADCVSTAPLFY